MRKFFLITAIVVIIAAASCRKDESVVPTAKDGEQVWHNKFTANGLNSQVELVSFKKTNGQIESDHYILYFEAQERYLTDNLKPKGTVATVKAAYEFQKTENGWLGPDNKIYEPAK